MNNVNNVVKENLCIGCGICKNLCKFSAINYSRKDGIYQPTIDENKCVNCGLCLKCCPSKGIDIKKVYKESTIPKNLYIGNYKRLYNVKTKSTEILNKSTSGGFITTSVKYLLDKNIYDSVFLVDTYNYSSKVETQRITKSEDLKNTPKSRYIPVSHEKLISYILENRKEKIIIIGTSCFITGFKKVCDLYKLNKDNYLLLGLFCDKTMNLNVFNYFEKKYGRGKKLKDLLFRDKEDDGWPGNVKLVWENNEISFLKKEERMKVKEYFCPEKCLYCLDKLNQFADISIGDNYSSHLEEKEGWNSIIIRTEKGQKIFNEIKEEFYIEELDFGKLCVSQHIQQRKQNAKNIVLKNSSILQLPFDENLQITRKDRNIYKEKLNKLKIGKSDNTKYIIRKINSRFIQLKNKVIIKTKSIAKVILPNKIVNYLKK